MTRRCVRVHPQYNACSVSARAHIQNELIFVDMMRLPLSFAVCHRTTFAHSIAVLANAIKMRRKKKICVCLLKFLGIAFYARCSHIITPESFRCQKLYRLSVHKKRKFICIFEVVINFFYYCMHMQLVFFCVVSFGLVRSLRCVALIVPCCHCCAWSLVAIAVAIFFFVCASFFLSFFLSVFFASTLLLDDSSCSSGGSRCRLQRQTSPRVACAA